MIGQQLFNDAKTSFNVWKLAILKVSLMAFVAGATSFQTSMNGLKWELLSWGDRFYILLGSVVVIANVVIAFIDQTMAKIGAEQKLLASDLEPADIPTQPTVPPKT